MKLSDMEIYEAKALAFYKSTGYMAPGKDVPAACGHATYDFRERLWKFWNGAHGTAVEMAIRASWELFGEGRDE